MSREPTALDSNPNCQTETPQAWDPPASSPHSGAPREAGLAETLLDPVPPGPAEGSPGPCSPDWPPPSPRLPPPQPGHPRSPPELPAEPHPRLRALCPTLGLPHPFSSFKSLECEIGPPSPLELQRLPYLCRAWGCGPHHLIFTGQPARGLSCLGGPFFSLSVQSPKNQVALINPFLSLARAQPVATGELGRCVGTLGKEP